MGTFLKHLSGKCGCVDTEEDHLANKRQLLAFQSLLKLKIHLAAFVFGRDSK